MFGLFGKTNSASGRSVDKVWKTEEAAYKGLLTIALQNYQQKVPTLIASFFEEDLQRLSAFMTESGIDHLILSSGGDLTVTSEKIQLIDIQASAIPGQMDFPKGSASQFRNTIYFIEHHPLISVEDKTLQVLTSIGFSEFVFCLSFVDPTLKLFGSDRILSILERLGLREDEEIEHDMVSKAIKNARKKIEKKVPREIKAKSAEEWYSLNVK